VVPEPLAPIRLARPEVGADELEAVRAVLESGALTMGPLLEAFESELARACGVAHALAVSSGTAALHLAVLALGLRPGDEVLVPAYTFPATANVVALAGLRPVLVDVDPATMNIDPDAVRSGREPARFIPSTSSGGPAGSSSCRSCHCSRTRRARSARAVRAACGSLGLAAA